MLKWFKWFKKKEVEEVEKFNFLATITMKNGLIYRIVGNYESPTALASDLRDFMEWESFFTAQSEDGKRIVLKGADIGFVSVDNEPLLKDEDEEENKESEQS